MGTAIDTVLASKVNPGATLTAATAATGDSFTVRAFDSPATAVLERITRGGAASGAVAVTSPMLHDNVRGIRFTSAETPSVYLMPQEIGQQLVSTDTLSVSISGGTAETDCVALSIYYSNLKGSSARLYNWGDVKPLVKNIKPVEVDCTNSATAGTWTDTLITTTENLLHANVDYAVLGYVCDISTMLVGVKGQETGNLRICGPGTTATDDTSDYFIRWAEREMTPHIPVVNAANAGSIYVSTADNTASTAPKVQLILAELSHTLP